MNIPIPDTCEALSDECPDAEFTHSCFLACNSEWITCMDACEETDFDCLFKCHYESRDCTSYCPCMEHCPNGCEVKEFKYRRNLSKV